MLFTHLKNSFINKETVGFFPLPWQLGYAHDAFCDKKIPIHVYINEEFLIPWNLLNSYIYILLVFLSVAPVYNYLNQTKRQRKKEKIRDNEIMHLWNIF